MKRKIKKYRPARVFFTTLLVSILFFSTAFGISAAYVRTERLRTGEARHALSVVSGDDGKLSVAVLGQEKSFYVPKEGGLSPLGYSLIPPELRVMWQWLLYVFGEPI